MALDIELVRPDDLLNLRFETANLRLDSTAPAAPALVVEDPAQPAFLIVHFPPQTIAESAYFEAAIVKPDGDPRRPDPDLGANPGQDHVIQPPLSPPGVAGELGRAVARMGRPSRLVFRVPPEARIPFTTRDLLDWAGLTLSVSPIAAIGRNPTAAQIAHAPDIQRPADHETALELPYRLIISPTADVAWAHRLLPFTAHGRTELWHTRLLNKTPAGPVELSTRETAPVRAIWSPDYTPNPPQPPPTPNGPPLGRTAMNADDRRQIVILTSAFHGYEVEVEVSLFQSVMAGGLHVGAGLGAIQDAVHLAEGAALGGVIGAALRPIMIKTIVPYVPAPFEVEQLLLSPLGGWLRLRGQWTPPSTARPPARRERLDFSRIFIHPDQALNAPFAGAPPTAQPAGAAGDPAQIFEPNLVRPVFVPHEDLDLSQWIHNAAQGRDHYVRIVYEGELWPFCHPAALIKVTERKFQERGGIVGAYLLQRMFIVVRDPLRVFAANEFGMPLKQVRLTTLITPDIADPEAPQARHVPGALGAFWVEVMTGPNPNNRDLFRFHAVGTDGTGHTVDFTIPLLFVSRKDQNNHAPVAKEYNRSANAKDREARMPGQTVTFAPPAPGNENTRLLTETINFVVGPDGCPPQVLMAGVYVRQVKELLGHDALTSIRYNDAYRRHGYASDVGVFAEIVKADLISTDPKDPNPDPFAGLVATTLGVTFQSDQAGGFATPNMGLTTLSHARGPVAGRVVDAVNDHFDPAGFFPATGAELFGSFTLPQIIKPGPLGAKGPQLHTRVDGTRLVTRFDWTPEVQQAGAAGVAEFIPGLNDQASTLTIHGVMERPLIPSPAAAPTFDFTGDLTNFTVGIVNNSVRLHFQAFHFQSHQGQKLDVQVQLDPAMPLEFGGDLEFVEELRKAIPQGLFGKGASVELLTSPLGVRAGFAFALPPVTVGVFALKDVSLGAALTLPFLDGKPVFDFNLSERQHPFLLTVAIFGGGGFFHLQLDTAGMKQLEVALEFGAAAALDIGVASGEVHIMAGIYFSLQRKESGPELVATLSGYMRLGGSLSVLGLIHVSVEFVLSFTYDGGKHKAYGRATLTVEVEVAFFSTSVELTVERAFGGQSDDPPFGKLMPPPAWAEYAGAFA